jgi:4'-phosphopantetheinyl transferase
LDSQHTITPIHPPILKLWLECASERFTIEGVKTCWDASDAVAILADIEEYDTPDSIILDSGEMEREHTFKTKYFKKRFRVSRFILKQILKQIVGEGIGPNLILSQQNKGRVILHGRPDIYISLSYSGNWVALALGKQKIGTDIEIIRQLHMRKILSCPIFDEQEDEEKAKSFHFLQQWTMMEAYAKLRDINLYPLIKERYCLNDTQFISYLIDNQSVLTFATDSPIRNATLMRIKPKDFILDSPREEIIAALSTVSDGDNHAHS